MQAAYHIAWSNWHSHFFFFPISCDKECCVSSHGCHWLHVFHFCLMRLVLLGRFCKAASSLSPHNFETIWLFALSSSSSSSSLTTPSDPNQLQRFVQQRSKLSQHNASTPSSIIHLHPLMSFPFTFMHLPQLKEAITVFDCFDFIYSALCKRI